jgi:hypothetical protein
LAKRNFPPGQHGVNRRKKSSEYVFSLMKSKKLSTLMEYWKDNSVTFSRRLLLRRV